jgi:hypothetical protein
MREEEGDTEFNCLKAFLTLIRANNWLGELLKLQVPQIAESGSCPTPIEFMQAVCKCAAQFDAEIANARHMLQQWPLACGAKIIPEPEEHPVNAPSKGPSGGEVRTSHA